MNVHLEITKLGDRTRVVLDIDYDSPEAAEAGLQRFLEAGIAMQAATIDFGLAVHRDPGPGR